MTYLTRRAAIAGVCASLATPALAQTYTPPRVVRLANAVTAGQIHVMPRDLALYWTLPDAQAIQYFVGVAAADRWTAGTFTVRRRAEWPRWTPTAAMIRREPQIYRPWAAGIPGGHARNPLGARALYLYRGNSDTYLRIHGSPPNVNVVGARVSNGCVQMTNDDVIDLYSRVPNGTRVVLHPA